MDEKTEQQMDDGIQAELLILKKPLTDIGTDYIFQKQLDQELSNIKTILAQPKGHSGAHVCGISGERGSGKTSFLNILKTQLDNDEFENVRVLDIIDPGVISKSLSLIELLVARIQHHVLSFTTEHNENCSDMNNVIDCLKNVIRVMAGIKGGAENFYIDVPNIEILNRIDNQANFEEEIKKLVDKYLNFLELKWESKKDLLILLIDDLDLVGRDEISYMLEDIRKYLPSNVLVILTYRNSQLLSNVIKDKYIENEQLIAIGEVTKEDVRIQAARYLEKLIPMDFRIMLLNQNELHTQPIYAILHDYPNMCKQLGVDNTSKKSFEEFVTDYIYDRSRIRINPVSSKERTSSFLPGNLRGMVQLLACLVKMDKLDDSMTTDDQTTIIRQNALTFESYFIQHSKEILDTHHSAIIEELENEQLERLHFYIYHEIRKNVLALKDYSQEKSDLSINKLNAQFKTDSSLLETYNLTVANVYTALEIYKDAAKSEMVYSFVYIIKVIYSIKILLLVLEAYKPKKYEKYQSFIGGKIIPDDFSYISRDKNVSFRADFSKQQWEALDGENKKLINKMTYTSVSDQSGLRTGREGEFTFNRYQSLYSIDANYEDAEYKRLPLDPFSIVLKKIYLDPKPQYIFYSMFDIDIITRSNFSRKNIIDALKRLNDIVLYPFGKYSSISDGPAIMTISNRIFKLKDFPLTEDKYLYTSADAEAIESLLVASDIIDITNKNVIKTKVEAIKFIIMLRSKITESSLNAAGKNLYINQLQNILGVLGKPKTRASIYQRGRIDEIMKKANIEISNEEFDAWYEE